MPKMKKGSVYTLPFSIFEKSKDLVSCDDCRNNCQQNQRNPYASGGRACCCFFNNNRSFHYGLFVRTGE